jgi:hypothetical protein
MYTSADEEAMAAYDALDAAVKRVKSVPFNGLKTPELFNMLERQEKAQRELADPEHQMINLLGDAAPAEIGGALPTVMADRLRITRGEATRRIGDAEVLGPRSTLTGERLEPMMPATAASQAAGEIGAGHVREIRQFFNKLPGWVDEPTKEQTERHLVKLAGEFRPDELHRAAAVMADAINPDGDFTDADRAQQRGLTIGRQRENGMSRVSGYLTPECRAGFDAVLNKLAAPGMCNPEHPAPVVDGALSEEAIKQDSRSAAQRNHDGLSVMCRELLGSGTLGLITGHRSRSSSAPRWRS